MVRVQIKFTSREENEKDYDGDDDGDDDDDDDENLAAVDSLQAFFSRFFF